jgi:CRISPR-associated protein Cas1
LQKEGGAVLMTDEGRRKVLKAWQEKKEEIIRHPHIGEKIKIGLIPYVQAQLLASRVRGDTAEYAAYLKV